MSKIYIIGDTHFNHHNIIEYCDRPFESVADMNDCLIANWNSVVNDDDKVIVNGDFALGGRDTIVGIGQQLKGHKLLILGNHDRASRNVYYEAGFEYVSQYPIIVDEFYIISHTPQYIQNKSVYANIFAHIHTNPMYNSVSSRSFCTSVERINYFPMSFDSIKKAMKQSEEVETLVNCADNILEKE